MSDEPGEPTSTTKTTELSDSNINMNVKDFFVKFNDISSRCKICCNVLKHHNNTTNLRNHLKRKHGEYINTDKCQKKLCLSNCSSKNNSVPKSIKENSSSVSTITLSSSISTQPKSVDEAFREIDSFSESGSSGSGRMYAKITNALLFMIATDNLPLWTVEQKGFLFFMKTVAPHYKVPGRTTITRRLDEKYYVLSKKLKDEFSIIENFTVTTDIWTDTLNTRGFLGVTVHYLGLDFIMNSIALGAYLLDQSHTHQYISKMLKEALDEWNIAHEKIVVFVTDNGANMVKAINDSFGVKKRLPCFAHTINLIVTNSLKAITRLKEIISKIKNIVTFFKQSVSASDELRKLQIQDGKSEGNLLKLIQECETRWNSTFFMIQRFLLLAPLISTILFRFPKPPMISHEEMNIMKDVTIILAPFEKVTAELSGESYPVCSKIIPIVHCLKLTFEKNKPETQIGKELQEKMLKEINRRFYSEESKIENNKVLSIATILDPRFKRIHFESPTAAANALSTLDSFIKKHQESSDISSPPHLKTPSTQESSLDIWNVHDNLQDIQLQNSLNLNTSGMTGMSNELKHYLDQSLINRSQDPIEHWNNLKMLYPTLHGIAMKYLSVVATSVPSERLFSKAGNIINEKRSRLIGKRLSKLIFLSSLNKEKWYLEE